jgi:hypothetical protein
MYYCFYDGDDGGGGGGGGGGHDDYCHCYSYGRYQELWVRWFQYGATCPIFRQHGARATEIWEYGPVAEGIVADLIRWRDSIRPYVQQEVAKLAATGRPVNRPLWWDFPTDANAWQVGCCGCRVAALALPAPLPVTISLAGWLQDAVQWMQ